MDLGVIPVGAVQVRRPGPQASKGMAFRAAGTNPGMSGMDKMKNKAEELSGQGKEAAGKATDDPDLQAEGQADQASGNLKQAGEKVRDVFK